MSELLKRVTRVEVIDETGRAYTRWNCEMTPSLQDDGRTLKVFVAALGPDTVRHFPKWRG